AIGGHTMIKKSFLTTTLAGAALLLSLAALPAALSGAAEDVVIGERPAVETHLDQSRIDSGEIGLELLIRQGSVLFSAVFNRLDGQGRPASTGTGASRTPDQPAFVRTSAPD